MSRNKGTFNFSANFEVLAKAPLDARQVVGTYSNLTDPSTWRDSSDLVWLYNGAMVAVANDASTTRNGIYFLADANNYTDPSSWIKSNSGGITDVSMYNVGDGSAHVFAGVDLSTGAFKFKSIVGSGAAIVAEDNDLITLSLDASFAGEVNTASNVGTGDVSLFYKKVSSDLQFRTIKGSERVVILYQDASTIRIDASIMDIISDVSALKIKDASLDASLGDYVRRAGDIMSGDLTATGISIINDLSVGNNAVIIGNLQIGGDLTVDGSVTYINTTELDVSTNFIKLNTGLIGIPPVTLQSGIIVERGSEDPYVFLFDETDNTFRIGISKADSSTSFSDASTQAVATREDNPIATGIAIWNNLMNRFDTSTGLTFDSSNGLYIDGSLRISSLAGSGIRYVTVDDNGLLNYTVLPSFVKESSLGSGFKWDASGYLTVDVSVVSDGKYNTLLDPSLSMPSAVGGYSAGTTVATLLGDSFITMFDNLLFPTVNPTYVAPSNSISDNIAAYVEIGSLNSVTITSGFNRGQILIGATEQNKRSGLPNAYDFSDPSGNTLLIDASSTSLSNVQTINNYVAIIGTQTFSNQVHYDIGPQPYTNKGEAYGTPLAAGTTTVANTSFEGVYPLYASTVTIGTLTKQTLVSMLSGNNIQFSMVAESGGNKQEFEIPTAWTGAPTNRSLVGVQQYNTVSGQWEYPGGSASASLLLWTTSASTETIQENVINYTKYTYNGTDRSAVLVRLVF